VGSRKNPLETLETLKTLKTLKTRLANLRGWESFLAIGAGS